MVIGVVEEWRGRWRATIFEKTTATIFGVNVTIVLNPLPKGVVFERNGHRLGDTTLGNVTTPGVVFGHKFDHLHNPGGVVKCHTSGQSRERAFG